MPGGSLRFFVFCLTYDSGILNLESLKKFVAVHLGQLRPTNLLLRLSNQLFLKARHSCIEMYLSGSTPCQAPIPTLTLIPANHVLGSLLLVARLGTHLFLL